jgi:hypothetical protein
MANAVIPSIDELITALGGPTAVARIVGRKPSAVCQWRTQGTIPPELYFVLRDAAARAGFVAPAALFRFEPLDQAG